MKRYLTITILLVVVGVSFVYIFFRDSLWLDFASNFMATFLGAVIGIPLAIEINNYIERSSQEERKKKIIPLLKEELLVNTTHLASWQKSSSQKIETVYTSIFLESSSWDAFSNNGELSCIRDPKVLSRLSSAYGAIRILREMTERYMDLVHLHHYSERKLLLSVVGEHLDKGIVYALEEISNAYKML